jgi:hypothetical protein
MADTHFSGPVYSANGFVGNLNTAGATAGTAGPGLISGSIVPVLTAAKGTLYINTSATTAATRLYINTDGAGTWAAFTAAA